MIRHSLIITDQWQEVGEESKLDCDRAPCNKFLIQKESKHKKEVTEHILNVSCISFRMCMNRFAPLNKCFDGYLLGVFYDIKFYDISLFSIAIFDLNRWTD